jgi:hypothetical protein
VKVAFVIVVGSIAALNVALIVLLTGTFKAALAGFVAVIIGATSFVLEPVVKLHGFGTPAAISRLLPGRNRATPVPEQVYDPSILALHSPASNLQTPKGAPN